VSVTGTVVQRFSDLLAKRRIAAYAAAFRGCAGAGGAVESMGVAPCRGDGSTSAGGNNERRNSTPVVVIIVSASDVLL
jgi:hypothetical protein